MTPGEALDALVDDIGDLSPEQTVLASVAVALASAMTEQAPPYALAGLARELRATLAALTGAPAAGQGVSDAEWER